MNTDNLHILLAEDDEDDSHLFKEAIYSINATCNLTIVNNGEKAVSYFKETLNLPDFIFLDINMPKMNGIEALKSIKELHPSNDLHVIMLSTAMSDKMVELSYRYGAGMYIQKPTKFNDLVDYLNYCLNDLKNTTIQKGFVLNEKFKNSNSV